MSYPEAQWPPKDGQDVDFSAENRATPLRTCSGSDDDWANRGLSPDGMSSWVRGWYVLNTGDGRTWT